MNHRIIDNALRENVFNEIESLMMGDNFPWYYNAYNIYRVANVDGQQIVESVPLDINIKKLRCKFLHTFYSNFIPQSPYFNKLAPICDVLSPLAMMGSRAFLSTYTGKNVNHGVHTDYDSSPNRTAEGYKNMKTAVFYLSTNNGGTLFEDGTMIESVRNRLVIFDSPQRHSAVTATDVPIRVVINFNYF